MTNIIIVDDHPLVRNGMRSMLENEADFQVVATFSSGVAALESLKHGDFPDVVVMDIRMPGMTGLETLAGLRKLKTDIAVLLLAGMPLKIEEDEARRLGANGYLPKSIDWERLVDAIRRVAKGNSGFLTERFDEETNGPLTAREAEVLRYINLGKTHEEIGIITGLSPETVRSHVKGIYRKLDCANAAGAVGRAYELGILRP